MWRQFLGCEIKNQIFVVYVTTLREGHKNLGSIVKITIFADYFLKWHFLKYFTPRFIVQL